MGEDSLTPPTATAADHAHTLARAGISSIPIVGDAAVELFEVILPRSLEKRKHEWMESVAEGISKLEAKLGTVADDLASNEAFIDTVLQASQAAVRTSEQEKRDALRNAVLNSALPHPLDQARRQMFIRWLDTLTAWHLRILRLFRHPESWFRENKRQPPQYVLTSSLSGLLTDAFPELKMQRDFYEKICKDLENEGLLRPIMLHTNMSATGAFEKRTTSIGDEFLRFVTDPTV